VFVDGTRQQIQYDGTPTQFTDNQDSFSLLPQTTGEVVTLKTAEQFRYVVQYVTEWSFAFQTNQDLQTGDVWAIGFGNPDLENSTDDTPGPNADGWFVYQNSTHGSKTAVLVEYRDGTEKDAQEIDLTKLPDVWGRLAGRTNWYNVGETNIKESYVENNTEGTQQVNDVLGTVGETDGKGPIEGNHALHASVKAGNGAGGVELEVGSIGIRTLGDVTNILRTKTIDFSLDYSGTTGEYEPLFAVRVDPDRDNVNAQFNFLEALEHSASDDVTLIANVFDSGNVLDGVGDALTDADFSSPEELNPTNSVIETSTAVEQVPDQTGTAQTSMPDPGGYQVAFGVLTASGSGGAGSTRSSSTSREQKRIIPNGDVAVVMARSPSTGTITADLQFEQDW
jgi:hypothetical protein